MGVQTENRPALRECGMLPIPLRLDHDIRSEKSSMSYALRRLTAYQTPKHCTVCFFLNTQWQDFIAVENYHWVNLFICCHDNSEVNRTNTVIIWHFTYLIGQWSTLLVDVALWQSWTWSSILSHGAVSEHGLRIQVAILQSVLST